MPRTRPLISFDEFEEQIRQFCEQHNTTRQIPPSRTGGAPSDYPFPPNDASRKSVLEWVCVVPIRRRTGPATR
jgi:hypothetical protein